MAIEVIWACLAALLLVFLITIARLPPDFGTGPLPATSPEERGWPQAAAAGNAAGSANRAPVPPQAALPAARPAVPAATQRDGRGRYQPRHVRGRTPQRSAGPPWGPAAPPPGLSP
jgi:hypothetical protein